MNKLLTLFTLHYRLLIHFLNFGLFSLLQNKINMSFYIFILIMSYFYMAKELTINILFRMFLISSLRSSRLSFPFTSPVSNFPKISDILQNDTGCSRCAVCLYDLRRVASPSSTKYSNEH